MELQVDDASLFNAGHGVATEASPLGGNPASLRTRLQAIAHDIDGLWRTALDSQNVDLVTRAVDASHGVHRALLALGEDELVIGSAGGGVEVASRLDLLDRTAS